jgi:putative NADH-flavin reductase
MKILLVGTGMIGSRVVSEALSRGHEVTTLTRSGSSVPGATALKGDAADSSAVSEAAAGKDAVVLAVKVPGETAEPLLAAGRGVLSGAGKAGVRRVIVVGGAGSLEVAPGVRLVDTPDFPDAYKQEALNQGELLDLLRSEAGALEWTYISPAAIIAPGERTGSYRVGGDQLLTDAEGNSQISAEDYAVALVDELEDPKAPRRRITVAH